MSRLAAVVLAGLGVLLTTETDPKNASSVIAVIIVAGYSVGAHLELRRSLLGVVMTAGTIAAVCIIKTPNDIFFPVVFFGIVPWAVGRVKRAIAVG